MKYAYRQRFDGYAKTYLSKPFPGHDTFCPVVLNYIGKRDKWKLISRREEKIAAPEMSITGPTPKFK